MVGINCRCGSKFAGVKQPGDPFSNVFYSFESSNIAPLIILLLVTALATLLGDVSI